MAFNDGTPIDAAELAKLQTTVNELKAKIPQIGAATTSVNIDNSTVTNETSPAILGSATTASITLTPGAITPFSVTFPGNPLPSVPKAVILTPFHTSGKYPHTMPFITALSTTGFSAEVFHPAGWPTFKTKFYYIVICN